jgi:glycosyltransferase involved in cell wall biosynthesis
VIVPTFNRADTLVRTLDSLARQTFDDFETIVIDDGSTDDTASVVKRLDRDHLSYRWQPNAGPSVARNLGAEMARGDYVTFIDTGDVAHADWLASFDTMIRAYNSEVVSCGADFTRLGVLMGTRQPRQLGPGAGRVIAYFRAGCFAVRRDLFWAVGGFDPEMRFSEVSELGMRLGQRVSGEANKVTHVARSLISVELPEGEGLGGRATSLAYSDERRLHTAVYILAKHHDVMNRAPALRQTYLRVAGVAASRLGDYAEARRFFTDAWRAQPRDLRELLRAAATVVPGLRTRLWPPIG